MKYCRACKLRAADSATACAKCGGPLSEFGVQRTGQTAAPSPAGPALGLEGEIRQLESLQQRNVRRTRLLLVICGLVSLTLLMTVYQIYSYVVLSYAALDKVQIEQDKLVENLIRVSFDVVKPGKVAFDRRSGGRRTEKLDVFTKAGPAQLSWAWPSEPATGIDFSVLFRQGLSRKAISKHFEVTGKRGRVDVVFLMDTTGSMEPFIQGLTRKCIEFSRLVQEGGYHCRLGLIGFGDVRRNEPIRVYEPTTDIEEFQKQVANLPRTDGGDRPESSIDALDRALELQYRSGIKVCFVHITDAPTHRAREIPRVARELTERKIVTHVVSQHDFENLYGPLCVNGGRFHAIQGANFDDILRDVARSIADVIKYD